MNVGLRRKFSISGDSCIALIPCNLRLQMPEQSKNHDLPYFLIVQILYMYLLKRLTRYIREDLTGDTPNFANINTE